MTGLRQDWAALLPHLKLLEPLTFTPAEWALLERLHKSFNDRNAHTHLPLPIARFRDDAARAIHDQARQLDDVRTASAADATPDVLTPYVHAFNDDVDVLMRVLVPSARYRKGHYAWGRFTVPTPHGLHTDHSAEDPQATGEPICIARIATLGTHYVAGDTRTQDAATQRKLTALRHWTAAPEGSPEDVFDDLLKRGTLRTIPVDHVVLMVAGNASPDVQITQHIAARPPDGGAHSAFFQRQYRLT